MITQISKKTVENTKPIKPRCVARVSNSNYAYITFFNNWKANILVDLFCCSVCLNSVQELSFTKDRYVVIHWFKRFSIKPQGGTLPLCALDTLSGFFNIINAFAKHSMTAAVWTYGNNNFRQVRYWLKCINMKNKCRSSLLMTIFQYIVLFFFHRNGMVNSYQTY